MIARLQKLSLNMVLPLTRKMSDATMPKNELEGTIGAKALKIIMLETISRQTTLIKIKKICLSSNKISVILNHIQFPIANFNFL